jgi:hypothetical protein
MSPDTLVDQMLAGAWDQLRAELMPLDVEAVNESVFRYFCIRHLPTVPSLRYETEWHKRVDLHVSTAACSFAVEFKWYARRHHRRDGRPVGNKGGASKQNEAEFAKSWRKLAEACAGHDMRPQGYLILVYEVLDEDRRARTFHRSYGGLNVSSLPEGCAARSISTLEPIELETGYRLHCKLFRLN